MDEKQLIIRYYHMTGKSIRDISKILNICPIKVGKVINKIL